MSRFYYEALASEKYFIAGVKEQLKQEKRNRFRETMRVAFFGTVALGLLAVAVFTMPVWVMALIELMEARGW